MFKFKIEDFAWNPEGPADNPRAKLREKIEINGCPMHLEAWEVYVDDPDGESIQRVVYDDADLDLIFDAVHASAHLQTVEIMGREYVLIATPYS